MPDDSANFGDGTFGGPLFGGAGTAATPATLIGVYGRTSLAATPVGKSAIGAFPTGSSVVNVGA